MIELCYNRDIWKKGDPDVEFAEELQDRKFNSKRRKGLSRQAILWVRRHFDNAASTSELKRPVLLPSQQLSILLSNWKYR